MLTHEHLRRERRRKRAAERRSLRFRDAEKAEASLRVSLCVVCARHVHTVFSSSYAERQVLQPQTWLTSACTRACVRVRLGACRLKT